MPENYTYDIASSSLATGICEAKINSKEWTAAATVAAGGLSGGVSASMADGDFWDGVCNGLICAGLNHAMHLVAEGVLPDDPPGKTRQVEVSKESTENEGGAVAAGSVTLIGGAAGQSVKVLDLSERSRLFKISKWSNKLGRWGVRVNAIHNYNEARKGNISYTSATVRTTMSAVEAVLEKIPYAGPIISISVTAYDIGGGFENNIYNVSDDWFLNLFDINKSSVPQSHGASGMW